MGKRLKFIIFSIGVTLYILGAVYKNFFVFFLGLATWLLILVVFLWRRFGNTISDPFAK